MIHVLSYVVLVALMIVILVVPELLLVIVQFPLSCAMSFCWFSRCPCGSLRSCGLALSSWGSCVL